MIPRRLAVLLLAGFCAACTPPVPKNSYVPPADASPETTATFIGSKLESAHFFQGDVRISAASIDGKNVIDTPVLVTPGEHRVTIGVSRPPAKLVGTRFYAHGSADVTVIVEAGQTYTARANMIDGYRADAWIEDASGKHVSASVPITMQKFLPDQPFFMLPTRK